jgi:spore coat protein U-like protein
MRLSSIIQRGLLRATTIAALVLTFSAAAHAKPANCSFTITNLNFGTVDLTANTTFDTTATLSANCTGNNNAIVRVCPNLANGTGGSTSGDPRLMLSGTNQLKYNLYQDSARTIVWGSLLDAFASSPPTIDITLNGSGSGSTSATIYGRVWAAQQALPPGSYTSSFSGTNTRIAYNYTTSGTCTAIGTSNATSAAFTVSATYSATCTVSSTAHNFGTAGVLATARTGSSTLTATCSASTPYTIALDGGTTGATDPTQRKMSKASEHITYGLYRDSARTQAWGSTTGVNTQGGTGSGSAQAYTVFGQVPAQATPSPGSYTDTIVATTTY